MHWNATNFTYAQLGSKKTSWMVCSIFCATFLWLGWPGGSSFAGLAEVVWGSQSLAWNRKPLLCDRVFHVYEALPCCCGVRPSSRCVFKKGVQTEVDRLYMLFVCIGPQRWDGDFEVYVAIHQKRSYECMKSTHLFSIPMPGDIPGSIRWARKSYENAKSCPLTCHEGHTCWRH